MSKKTNMTTTSSQSTRPGRRDEPARETTEAPGATSATEPPAGAAQSAPGLATATEAAVLAPVAEAAKEATAGPAEGEAKKSAGAVQIVTRFPVELGARLDRYLAGLRGERFGLRVSRADAVRILVHQALEAHERGTVAATTPHRT